MINAIEAIMTGWLLEPERAPVMPARNPIKVTSPSFAPKTTSRINRPFGLCQSSLWGGGVSAVAVLLKLNLLSADFDQLFFFDLAAVLGDLHRTELRSAHRAEGSVFEA